jgi:hypothetical protein
MNDGCPLGVVRDHRRNVFMEAINSAEIVLNYTEHAGYRLRINVAISGHTR